MKIAVIGGGPAGLRAAEVAAQAGASVTLFDAKPSGGRKFLVAGKGGLNITKAEPLDRFVARYSGPDLPRDLWTKMVGAFAPDAMREWALGLGIETFVASTGRVYPREMKAAPLLRRWVQRLRGLGVQFAMHHRWVGISGSQPLRLELDVLGESTSAECDAAIFALGGGSWPETGSDGGWVESFERLGIATTPLQPANCGWELTWPADVLTTAEGQPLKNITTTAGETKVRGELLVTRYGLEGGAIYQLGAALRAMHEPEITIDFKPDSSIEQLVAKMGPIRRNFVAEAQNRWHLPIAVAAIVVHVNGGDSFDSAFQLATVVKACRLRLTGPRPIAEAISSAGGIRWSELDGSLMLRKLPGVFAAGEMIDWEAPTGGYLMQGCFATGTHAARAAVEWLRSR